MICRDSKDSLINLDLTFLAGHAANHMHSPFTVCDNMSSSPLPPVPATLGGDSTGRQREDVEVIHYY